MVFDDDRTGDIRIPVCVCIHVGYSVSAWYLRASWEEASDGSCIMIELTLVRSCRGRGCVQTRVRWGVRATAAATS